ncbi:MAG: hypothetical protein IJA55_01765 [Clostridia bacterium]|nr:hypothetical protein [Clostridia bacterium]
MKALKFIFKNIIYPASFFFTIFNIIVYIIDYMNTRNTLGTTATPKLVQFLLILAYFMIIALSNNIFKTDISTVAKISVHYLSILIPLMAYVITRNMNGAIVGVFMIVTILYAVIATPLLIVRKITSNRKNESEKYEKQFK